MNKKAQIALIEKAFTALDGSGAYASWGTVAEKLYDMNLEAERRHREGRPAVKGFSIGMAAKLFACKHIAESLQKPNKWTVQDIISIRNECLYAQAYVNKDKNKELIESAWEKAGVKIEDILAIDYSDLMK